jgi:hypothetical protein
MNLKRERLGLAEPHQMHLKTTVELRAWSRSSIPQGKLVMLVCREVIDQLKRA